MRTLIDFYRSSQHCYAALEKVEEISKYVSLQLASFFHCQIIPISTLLTLEVLTFFTISIVLQKGTVLDLGGSQASFFMQAFTLTKRSFINMSRDFGYYWLRLVIYVVVTICIGTIYLNVGTGYNSILVFDFVYCVLCLLFLYFLIILLRISHCIR